METKICSKCNRELALTHFHKNGFNSAGQQKYRGYCKECANSLERDRYLKKKQFIDSQKHCCAKCGDTRIYVLDFHHKNKEEKEFTIGRIKKGSLDLIQNEIDKCVIFCSNCHREFHYLEKNNGITLEEYLDSRVV